MKKILLGLLAVSAMSFAASNPGDNETSATSKHKGEVGVPLEVRVNILPQESRLVLVDENNRLIDKLVFDHGSLIMGAAVSDSVVEKTVKLTTDKSSINLGANHVQFAAKNSIGTPILSTNDFILNGHGTGSSEKSIKSKLIYREDKFNASSAKEVSTKVKSVIPATELNGSSIGAGLYVGSGTFEATVTNS